MASEPVLATRTARLVAHLVPDHGIATASGLAAELRLWIESSRRFREFAETHRDKIRKKVREAAEPDALLDVRAELVTAHRIAAHPHLGLAWEAAGTARGGPDFLITHRGDRPFSLEVTRLRGDTPRVGRTVVAKLRQLPPSVANVLLLVADPPPTTLPDPASAIAELLYRAHAGDDTPFTARGLVGARDFRQRMGRLGATIVWAPSSGTAGLRTWENPAARIAVPPRALRAVGAALVGAGSGRRQR